MKSIEVRVEGKVQGVFYRKSTQQRALELAIKGWVKNEPDGSVRIRALGPMEALSQLVDWCQKGPENARVSNVQVQEVEALQADGFEIKY